LEFKITLKIFYLWNGSSDYNVKIFLSELGIDLDDQPTLESILAKVREEQKEFFKSLSIQQQHQDDAGIEK